MQALAQNPLMWGTDQKKEIMEKLSEYKPMDILYEDNKDKISSFYRLDANGIVIEKRPTPENMVDKDFSHKPDVAYVIKNHKPVASFLTSSSGKKLMSISIPIMAYYNKNNKLSGILRVLIDPYSVNKKLEHISLEGKGYAWLEDSQHTIIAHPDAQNIGKRSDKVHEGSKALIAQAPISILNQIFYFGMSLPYEDIAKPIDEHAKKHNSVCSIFNSAVLFWNICLLQNPERAGCV